MKGLNHILAIAGNTLTEALRQRILYVLVVFGLVLLALGTFGADFSLGDEFKFMKDSAYAAISMIGLVVALVSTSQLIPSEIERRTIYTLLSKPVQRHEFILGKYLGLVAVLTLNMLLMALIFFLVLRFKGALMIASQGGGGGNAPGELQAEQINLIRHQIQDPAMLQAFCLLWAKLCIVIALAVLFSTVATSTVFIACMTLLVYFAGHLQSIARESWLNGGAHTEWLKSAFLAIISLLVPDFQAYSLIDEMIAGNAVSWHKTAEILAYSGVYIAVVMALSALIFEEREL